MLILKWWSLGHFLSIFLPMVFIAIAYLILRKRTPKTQKIVVLTLMLINVAQHLFKSWVWYPLYKGVFDLRNITFCNVCATSILVSPIIFVLKNKGLKDALFYHGLLGGIMSLWFVSVEYGVSIISLEFIRYFSCHAILMMTSILPVLLGLHTLSMKRFWVVGVCFIAAETIVFLDNFLILAFQNKMDWSYAYNKVYQENQLLIMHAPTPAVFEHTFLRDTRVKYLIDDGTCFYIPVLWSLPALLPAVSGFALLVTWLLSKIKLDGRYLAEKWKKEEIQEEPEEEQKIENQ